MAADYSLPIVHAPPERGVDMTADVRSSAGLNPTGSQVADSADQRQEAGSSLEGEVARYAPDGRLLYYVLPTPPPPMSEYHRKFDEWARTVSPIERAAKYTALCAQVQRDVQRLRDDLRQSS
jgi:hypothetical protein